MRTFRHPEASTLQTLTAASGREGRFHSLPTLARAFPNLKRRPHRLRIVLESVLRPCDGRRVTKDHVARLAHWGTHAEGTGMGVLPLRFEPGDRWNSLALRGDEAVDMQMAGAIQPPSDATLVITHADGARRKVPVVLRIDTAIGVGCHRHGGILPFLLRQLLAG